MPYLTEVLKALVQLNWRGAEHLSDPFYTLFGTGLALGLVACITAMLW